MTQHSSPDYELIAFLKGIDTPTVANAIEVLDVCSRATGFPSLELRCLFPELGVMCGYAVTAHVETVTDANPKTEEAFVELFEAVERSEKPAVVVVQEIGGDRDRAAHCGEVMSAIFGALGGIGSCQRLRGARFVGSSKARLSLFRPWCGLQPCELSHRALQRSVRSAGNDRASR